MLSEAEKRLLTSFNTHGVRFMVIGMSAAVIQGVHAVTEDIDLWFESLGDEKFVDAVTAAGAFYIAPGVAGANPPMLGPREFRLFDLVTHAHGLESFSTEYATAKDVMLDGVALRILPLERIIASKEAINREKDRVLLPILRTALQAVKKVES